MKVSAKLNNLRIASRKVRLVANLIKGLDVQDAMNQLAVTVKAGSPQMRKLVQSAMSNAENNFGIDRDNMYVFNVLVGAGATLKRWMPKAYGRAGMIHKRTSQIEVIIDERVEGKGRKSKDELDKEKKKRIEAKKKIEKEAKEKAETKKETKVIAPEEEKKELPGKAKGGKGNWTNKIFRRKSM